jgi:hypothetical protein
MGIGRNMHSISNALRPVLILLRCLGYFPGFVRYEKRQQKQIRFVSFAKMNSNAENLVSNFVISLGGSNNPCKLVFLPSQRFYVDDL